MEMAESGEELVLQWPGHAAHVTERFSGLLARQALVDVTLICQGQELRVHKLVLASSSLYFEEILEQDLGQEPIILLRDLDFEILKAMVEFMYCGETTISQCYLQRLLEAARVFKVKELRCIVESMMKSGMEKLSSSVNGPSYKDDSSAFISEEEKNSASELASEETVKSERDRAAVDDDDSPTHIDDDNSSYEIGGKNEGKLSIRSEQEESSSSDDSSSKSSASDADDDDDDDKNELPENAKTSLATDENPLNCCCELIDEPESRENHDSRGLGECSRVYTHKKRKFVDNFDDPRTTLTEESSKFDDYSNDEENADRQDENCGKSLKVYTHKRRKSSNERRSAFFDNVRQSTIESSSTNTSSIDLSDDKTSNDARLFSSLDTETSEYVWSLTADNLQSVVGGAINSSDLGETTDDLATKKLLARRETSGTPILRRSVRINQLESDDSFNNNNATVAKEDEKSSVHERNNYEDKARIDLAKSGRRSSKHADYRITDENNRDNSGSIGEARNSRSLRSRMKLSSRKSSPSRNATSRYERRKNTRQNRDKTDGKIVSPEISVNKRLNTIASVDRALWGDMSDIMDNRDDSQDNSTMKYSTSREIPFAVGLLPLRAALERMQATLDHQPRKTRSSVAPWRQETVVQRRRLTSDNDNSPSVRKQMNFGDIETAVCRIEIRTSSSGRNDLVDRRVSTDERIVALGENAKIGEQ